MQQPPQLMNITTEQIQKYLDENKELIMAIMENQNQGKLAESASYQAQLQQNLMYLAKIADSQPQASASASASASSQMPPQSAIPQEQHVQSAQAAMAKQHPCFLAPKLPFHLNDQPQQQQPEQSVYLQQQQFNQPQVGLRSVAPSGTYLGVQTGMGNNFMNIQGNKQDSSEDGGGEGFRKSSYGRDNMRA
ncbi:hypothetical protein ES332_D03G146100v1 [Gossypium tomentosum]|uniref:SS18 N-terminal domain-containing protein n=1 Tax=Gossypium tomentosum TaxID=34277 RepID=A0A5D2LN23_GOSTO|nr:hypothetical protein ES332_D03G146100v1 [Gossypium tomentosum]TYH80648.1 hypothetical protein ES332_D03G146100v1 [Gossypium tomentosum]